MCEEHAPVHQAWVPLQGAVPDVLSLDPVDRLDVTVLVDNVADMLLADVGPAKRPHWTRGRQTGYFEEGAALDQPLAEHGFSVLLTLHLGEHRHHVLFDTGVSAAGCVENMSRLDVAPADIEAIVLSHGHFDHTGGLEGLVQRLGRRRLPLVLHPHAWNRRRVVLPGRDPFELPTPSKQALLDANFEIIEQQRPSFLFKRSLLVTGEVDRTTSYETGLKFQQVYTGTSWEPDPLTLDDQAVIVNIKDKGLVVFTGCGHAGVVNILRYVRRLTGVAAIHAVMGGFHLVGAAGEAAIPLVCEALDELQPDYIVPAHCTGWKAQHAFAARFPQRFIPNSVGTRFTFGEVV
jgi:7,8-dihydropterin-6-yl-methyl-4-(beta-D-ribofuranosyl)aminobenzene 5'-phosphate synthase